MELAHAARPKPQIAVAAAMTCHFYTEKQTKVDDYDGSQSDPSFLVLSSGRPQ